MNMKWSMIITVIFLQINCHISAKVFSDKPCAARAVYNRSVVCVCTAEYCDTVVRETPGAGEYYTYVSSEGGLRFRKTKQILRQYEEGSCYSATLDLDPTAKYQTIKGFGGAVTDAAGINWKNLTDPQLMQNFIESYFGSTGIEYNMLRVPIGGSDYSTHGYAYNELPENDEGLSNYTLAFEDCEYKIPMIKAIMEAAIAPMQILASTWSPPKWMKTNKSFLGNSRILKEYYQAFADYHLRFIEEYDKVGIPIWGITTTNEPLNGGLYTDRNLNDLGWNIDDLAVWILNNLGPTIRNSTYKDVKIITGDDQRYAIPLYWNMMIFFYPDVVKYIDGIAVHYYFNTFTPAAILTETTAGYPDVFLIGTEACAGATSDIGSRIDLGSWKRAETYMTSIIEDFNHNVTGWIEWNLCLDTDGAPTYLGGGCDSSIVVDAGAGEFLKQPTFYAMGHFSKFVPRGSRRIKVSERTCQSTIQNVAFITPNDTIVVILFNEGVSRTIRIHLGEKEAVVALETNSFTTVEFNNYLTGLESKKVGLFGKNRINSYDASKRGIRKGFPHIQNRN